MAELTKLELWLLAENVTPDRWDELPMEDRQKAKALLEGLVERGLLEHMEDEPGYFVTDKGREALGS